MKICPTCQSSKGLRKFAYGLPSSDLAESIYVSGGCRISEYDPTLKCIKCGWLGAYESFLVPGLTVSRLFEGQDTYWITVDIDGKCLVASIAISIKKAQFLNSIGIEKKALGITQSV